MEEMSFLNHKADGIWRKYDIDGYVFSETRYLNDKLNGLSTEIEYRSYYDGEPIKVDSVHKTNYLNGNKHGDEIREDGNGNIIQIDHYINGVIQPK
jgi:antitoxin component YwqK of YwqJK toxin-antitoxin module